MAEVKSTLDLVMEKTKNMVQTDEEKEKAKNQERENLARGIVLGLTEERLLPEELPQAMNEAEQEDPDRFRSTLIKTLIQAVGFDSPVVLTESLKFLTGESGLRLVEGLENILGEYTRAEKSLTEATRSRLTAELKAVGISGSAVQPNLKVDESYLADLNAIKQEYRDRLDRARKNLADQADRF